jgi:8-oxo-dGTP diphosphatase
MSTELERFKLHATAILLLVKDGKILLCRRFNTGWEDGKYGFMAGHIDGNEPFTVALCREAKEELGIEINPQDVHFVHVQHHCSNKEYVYMYFTASAWQGEMCDGSPWMICRPT